MQPFIVPIGRCHVSIITIATDCCYVLYEGFTKGEPLGWKTNIRTPLPLPSLIDENEYVVTWYHGQWLDNTNATRPEPYIGYPCPCPQVLGGHGHGCDIIVHTRSLSEIIATVSLALQVNRDTTAKFNILLWWKLKRASTFPIMLRVARSVMCIPASNSKSESNFSDATKKHSGLKPTTMNDLLFVRSNQNLV